LFPLSLYRWFSGGVRKAGARERGERSNFASKEVYIEEQMWPLAEKGLK
jgi:hypothetical protein